MAYNILHSHLEVPSKRKAIGVKMPFSSDDVFVPTYDYLEACKVNLYNFFLTEKGERYLNPELGNSLLQYLFSSEQNGQVDRAIQDNVRFEIERFFPRLEIVQIHTEDFPDEHGMQVSIQFRLKGTELEDELVLDINR